MLAAEPINHANQVGIVPYGFGHLFYKEKGLFFSSIFLDGLARLGRLGSAPNRIGLGRPQGTAFREPLGLRPK